jgi:hypothetical protein
MIFAPILFTVQSSEKHFIFPFRVPALDKDSYRADVDLATYFIHIPACFPGKPNDLDGLGIFGNVLKLRRFNVQPNFDDITKKAS